VTIITLANGVVLTPREVEEAKKPR